MPRRRGSLCVSLLSLPDQQRDLTLHSVARLQSLQNLSRAPAQKFFMQLGHFARDHHVPGVSQNLDYVRERFDNPVRSFVENLGARRSLDRLQHSPPLSAFGRKKSAEAK